jgi:hypothetical protein
LYKGRAVGGKERAEFEADRHLTDCPKWSRARMPSGCSIWTGKWGKIG